MLQWSAALFVRLGLRDYARFDWKLGADGRPRLLEANPNCGTAVMPHLPCACSVLSLLDVPRAGWSYDAHLQRMSALAGISYSEMLRIILEAAERRYELEDDASGPEQCVSLEQISLCTHSQRCAEKQLSPHQKAPLFL
jgi:D-alanine-D-alanine ligase